MHTDKPTRAEISQTRALTINFPWACTDKVANSTMDFKYFLNNTLSAYFKEGIQDSLSIFLHPIEC